MALIKCRECQKEISDKAKKCPHCGYEKQVWTCPECNNEVDLKEETCLKCGYKIKNNKNNGKYIIIIAVAAVTLITFFIILVIVIKSLSNNVNLKEVFEKVDCDNYYCELADDGSYLAVDTNPLDIDDFSSYTATSYIEDINKELGFTDSLYSKMENTRALDGTLTDENKKVKVSWTYHPDKGLSVIYYKK